MSNQHLPPPPTFQTSRQSAQNPPQEELTPQSEEQTSTTTSQADTDGGAHLDAFMVPDFENEDTDPDAPVAVGEDGLPETEIAEAGSDCIDKDAFFTVFQTAFNMPGMFVKELAPLGIQPEEQGNARAASDATYGLLEIYYPNALKPQSETLAHVLVAGPFFIAKAMVAREAFKAMRRPKQQPIEAKAQPAPEAPPQAPANSPDQPLNDWHNADQEATA